jgi:hypothetical protein
MHSPADSGYHPVPRSVGKILMVSQSCVDWSESCCEIWPHGFRTALVRTALRLPRLGTPNSPSSEKCTTEKNLTSMTDTY